MKDATTRHLSINANIWIKVCEGYTDKWWLFGFFVFVGFFFQLFLSSFFISIVIIGGVEYIA